ncbi:MAG TPA: hypothetical protein VJ715_01315, partial [Pyrinomonadaceae bacterium]|nr:hypothetical protein [Pyrinomonadaceae bacterium]
RAVYLLTAVLFVFWKSAYAQPLIDFCDQWLSLPVSRTVDLTDLIALSVLPASYAYGNVRRVFLPYRFVPHFVGCVSLFAFTATTYVNRASYSGKEYAFTEYRADLVAKAMRIDERNENFRLWAVDMPGENPKYSINIRTDVCSHMIAHVRIEDKTLGSVVILDEMSYDYDCPKTRENEERMLYVFERDFITALRLPEPLRDK